MQAVRRDWAQTGAMILIVIFCIGAIGALQMPQLKALKARSQTVTTEQLQREVETEKAQLLLLRDSPTFGFNNLLADWVFLNFLQYFGDEPARSKTDYRLSPDYFDVILKRDPYFLQAYTFLSTSSAIYAGMPQRSVEIMRRELSRLKPNAPVPIYYAWRQLAIDELLFLGDGNAAKKSFETAAQWARASSFPDSQAAAAVSEQTANLLSRNPNSKTAQVAAWAMVLSNAPDAQTRKIALTHIQQLGSKIVGNADGSFSISPPHQD